MIDPNAHVKAGEDRDALIRENARLRALLLQAREVGRGFQRSIRNAIIQHNANCAYFKTLLAGFRPKTDDPCDCQAKPTAKKLLAFMQATKDLEPTTPFADPEPAITASPCGDCRCGSLCHWDDLRTPPQGASAADWAVAADRDRIPCQRCPCKGYRIPGTPYDSREPRPRREQDS
jgi:hypothetical protein